MSISRVELLRWQFELTWSLVELHLDALETADHLWEPAPSCWTVRPGAAGEWVPDWETVEPDPPPVPTVAWLTWHVGWWWTVTMDHASGRTPRERTDIAWPGDGASAVRWLRDLHAQWAAHLGDLTDEDLDAVAPFPWQDRAHSVAQMVAWVTMELAKNGAEIGQLRLLHRAVGG